MTPEPVWTDQGSHLICRVLTPAIRLWLNTQVETVDYLAIAIESSDRQILGGYIPLARVAASVVNYRGLHLESINVVAESIRTNGLRVFRGQAFTLLEPLPIEVSLTLTEANLNDSLQSALFARAVDDLMQNILAYCIESWFWNPEKTNDDESGGEKDNEGNGDGEKSIHLADPQISLLDNRLVICGTLIRRVEGRDVDRADSPDAQSLPLHLDTGLVLKDGRTLAFQDPQLVLEGITVEGRSHAALQQFTIDLGETTELNTLTLENQCLTCQGRIMVMP